MVHAIKKFKQPSLRLFALCTFLSASALLQSCESRPQAPGKGDANLGQNAAADAEKGKKPEDKKADGKKTPANMTSPGTGLDLDKLNKDLNKKKEEQKLAEEEIDANLPGKPAPKSPKTYSFSDVNKDLEHVDKMLLKAKTNGVSLLAEEGSKEEILTVLPASKDKSMGDEKIIVSYKEMKDAMKNHAAVKGVTREECIGKIATTLSKLIKLLGNFHARYKDNISMIGEKDDTKVKALESKLELSSPRANILMEKLKSIDGETLTKLYENRTKDN